MRHSSKCDFTLPTSPMPNIVTKKILRSNEPEGGTQPFYNVTLISSGLVFLVLGDAFRRGFLMMTGYGKCTRSARTMI